MKNLVNSLTVVCLGALYCGCMCGADDVSDTHVNTSSDTSDVSDTSAHAMTSDVPLPVVGDPCVTQDDCMSQPGGLYCVPEHHICSISCVSDVDCQPGIAGTACVAGWCGIPCDELSPYQCGLLSPSAVCIDAAGREMCGNQ